MVASFLLGLLCGGVLGAFGLRLLERPPFGLGEDERYLLAAARAARGRLVLRPRESGELPPQLVLKEYANPRRIEDRGQVDRLVRKGLLVPDPSGVPGRLILTEAGWKASAKLPEFPQVPVRQGAWYNSISRPRRGVGTQVGPAARR